MNETIEQPQENWEELYWLAVETIQGRYKSIPTPLIAKIAEAVTAEPIPSGQNKHNVLSNRIAAEVKAMREPQAVPPEQMNRSRRAPRPAVPGFPRLKRSGLLTIVKFAGRDSQGHNFWLALCDCQKHNPNPRFTRVREDNLSCGRVTSCGCHRIRLMRDNQRARKQSRRHSTVEIPQRHENASLASNPAGANLVLRKAVSAPPTCRHGFKLIKLDFERGDGKARYCELCGLMNDMPAARSTNWAARLKHENLGMDRGLAPSTDSPTSPKARKFSKTADKVWAAGKNNVLVGGSGELEITGAARAQAIIGRRRSASGRDKIKPWQNPNVDFDETVDTADNRLASRYEPGDRYLDHQGFDRRVAERPEEMLDKQTRGLDDCYGDRDERALLKYESDEKAINEDSSEAIADDDGEDLKGETIIDSEKPSCDD